MANKISGIYKIENAISGKAYIGQSGDVKRRWKAHIRALSRGKHENGYLQSAWDKDGPEAFSFSLIEECASRERMNERETYWANAYAGRSYNLGATGKVGTMSGETKEKLRAAHVGKKLSEEHRRRISEGCAGRKRSAEERSKMARESVCAKAVFCIELNARFFSLADAERKLGIKRSGICHALKNHGKTAGKADGVRLHWRYE